MSSVKNRQGRTPFPRKKGGQSTTKKIGGRILHDRPHTHTRKNARARADGRKLITGFYGKGLFERETTVGMTSRTANACYSPT